MSGQEGASNLLVNLLTQSSQSTNLTQKQQGPPNQQKSLLDILTNNPAQPSTGMTDSLKALLFSSPPKQLDTTPSSSNSPDNSPKNQLQHKHGQTLPKKHCKINLATHYNPCQNINPQTITLVPSKINYCLGNGKSIAVDQNFICYAVRGGKIRVICQSNGSMALLRGHTNPIVDLSILTLSTENGNTSSRLASICSEGVFVIWSLDCISADVLSKPILTIKGKTFSSASPPRFHKSLWSTPSCLAIAGLHHDVFLLNIEKIIELNQEKCGLERGYIVNELELDTGLEGLEGVKKVSVDGVPTDICFSKDATILCVSTNSKLSFINAATASTIHHFEFTGMDSISCIQLIENTDSSTYYTGPLLILVGFNQNKLVKILGFNWDVLYELELSDIGGMEYVQEYKSLVWCGMEKSGILSFLTRVPKLLVGDDEKKKISFLGMLQGKEVDFGYDGVGFEFMAEVPTDEPILSFICTRENNSINVFGVQAKAVQQYTLPKEVYRPKGWNKAPLLSSPFGDLEEEEDQRRSSGVIKKVVMDDEIEVNGLTLSIKEAELAHILGKSEEKLYSPPLTPISSFMETESLEQSLDLGIDGKIISKHYAHGFVDEGEGDLVFGTSTTTPLSGGYGDVDNDGTSSMGSSSRQKRVSFSHLNLMDFENTSSASVKPADADDEVKSQTSVKSNHSVEILKSIKKSSSPRPSSPMRNKEATKRLSGGRNSDVSFSLPDEIFESHSKNGSISSAKQLQQHQHGISDEQFQFLVGELKKIELEKESNLKNTLSYMLPSILEKTMKNQLDGLSASISLNVGKQIANTVNEKFVSDLINKTLNKTKLVDSISKSVVNVVQPGIEKMFKDTFKTSFLPGMQKAVNVMFKQIHETLEKGLQEAFQTSGSAATSKDAIDTKLNKLMGKIDKIISFDNLGESITKSNTNFLETLKNSLTKELKGTLSTELAKQSGALTLSMDRLKNSSMTSNSPITPIVAELDIKTVLEGYLENSDYEVAFTKALEAGDLASVVWLCNKVQPKLIFLPSGSLVSQPVILSLIHQLSIDIRKSSSVKLSWIQECLMNIDTSDQLVVPHFSKVLKVVSARIDDLIKTAENDGGERPSISVSVIKMAKVIAMIVKGLMS